MLWGRVNWKDVTMYDLRLGNLRVRGPVTRARVQTWLTLHVQTRHYNLFREVLQVVVLLPCRLSFGKYDEICKNDDASFQGNV